MRDIELITRRNKLIYERYIQLFFGEGKREELIYPILSVEFHVSPSTIYRIVLRLSKEAASSQTKLPLEGQGE